MTAATLAQLPLAAGGAIASGAGRALMWGVARYARAPIANTSILLLTTLTALAGSNALYFQHGRHPAPLFAPAPEVAEALPTPVTPAVRKEAVVVPPVKQPEAEPVVAAPAQTAAVAPPQTIPAQPIGNADVFELQRKLAALGLFSGTVDGFYGPQTAAAIRRFEERAGLTPLGEFTPEILDAVMRAPLAQPQAAVSDPEPPAALPATTTTPNATLGAVAVAASGLAPAPSVVPDAVVTGATQTVPTATAEVGAADLQPLPTPQPLQLSLAEATTPQPIVKTRQMPQSVEEVTDIAIATAGNAVDAAVSVMENGIQFGPEEQAMPAKVTTVAAVSPDPIAAIVTEPAVPAGTNATDPKLVAQVQRGLSSLGFLHGPADGVAGEATAKAIRNFEVYYNYDVTGRVSPELIGLLSSAGASF
jgi:peptidoglycan hydrolase-like protein with peptidoglycan-binding domain